MAVYDPLADLPTVDQALSLYPSTPAPVPTGPSGTGNLVTSALGSGAYGALGALGQGVEAGARAVGADRFAQSAADFAARQRATANTYARPDLEQASILSPSGFAYQMLKGLPTLAGVGAGALAGEALAPVVGVGAGAAALLGGGVAAYPLSVGENIERARQEGQPVDQGASLKALALGVPEAALQAALPAMGEGMLMGRIGGAAPKLFGSQLAGKAAVGAAAGAAVQAPAAAAGEALMQQMGDPNRTFAQRSQEIVNAALSGGVQGAFFGGVLHSFAKKPVSTVTDDDLLRVTAQPLGLPAPEAPQLPPPGAPGTEARLQPPQRFAPEPAPPTPGAPGVVTPEAQPGQAIRQLTDQTAPVLPGRQPASGEVIPLGQTHVGEDVPPPPAPAQLEPPQRFPPADGGAANERVSRPSSDDEALITPPPAGGDVTTQSNAGLLATLEQHGPASEVGQRIMGELTTRLKGVDTKGRDIRDVLAEQDDQRAKDALAAQQTAQIKKVTRGFIPDFLKPHLGDDAAVKGAIFDEAKARDAADKPLGSRLTAIAKDFGVMDERGALVDPRAGSEQADTARAQNEADQAETTNLGPTPDVPTRVMREAIPEAHQPKWDALEGLRKDAPTDFVAKIDDLQSKLAAPRRGEVGQIAKATKELREAIEGQKAVDKVTGEAPVAKAPLAPVDETQGAGKFDKATKDVPPAEDLSARLAKAKAEGGARGFNDEIQRIGAEALSRQDQLKAKQRGNTNAVQERSPAAVPVREAPRDSEAVRGGDAQGQDTAAKVEAPAGGEVAQPAGKAEVAPEHASAIAKALKAVRANIGALMEQKLPERTRKAKGQVVAEAPQGYAKRQGEYQAALDQLDRAQSAVGKALKSGDVSELAKIGDNHFPSKAYDDFYDQLPAKGQKLLDEHAKKVDDLLQAVKEAVGTNHPRAADAFTSRAPSAHDEAIGRSIDQGRSARDILADIARNGSNSIRRTMAAKLLQMSKVNPSVRFGTLDEMTKDHPTLRNVFGDYHDELGRIRIFDRADSEHTMLHEFAHAATVRAIERDPAVSARAKALHDAAKAQMTPEEIAHPSMSNPAEMVAEAMANPDFASLLDGMKGPGKTSLWQAVKDFVRELFGFPKNAESLLDHVESLAGEAARIEADNSIMGMERATGLYARSAQDAGERISRAFDRTLDPRGIPSRLFKAALFWRNMDGIAASMSRWLPSLAQHVQNIRDTHNYVESFLGKTNVADNARRSLDRKGQDVLNQLTGASFRNIDPRRTPDKHTWIPEPQRSKMAPEIRRYNEMWNQAKRGDAAVAKAYELTHNSGRADRFAGLVALGRNVIKRSESSVNLVDDPMERFNNDTTGMKNDPRKAEAFWREEFNSLLGAAQSYISRTEKMFPTKTAEEVAAMRTHLADLKSWERDATRASVAMTQAPNFPARRFGDHFVSFKLAGGFTPAQVAQLRQMLSAKGFDAANIDHNIDNNQAYMRVDGAGVAQNLKDIIKEAAKLGLVDPKSIDSNETKTLHRQAGILPSHVTNEIKAFRDAFPKMAGDDERAVAYNAAVERQLDQMQQSLLDMLPDTNISKLFAEREDVLGASTDMGKAFLDRSTNTARAVANLFMTDRNAQARKGLRAEVETATRDPDMSVGLQSRVQAAANEALLRDGQRQWKVEKNAFDTVRKWTHFFELGISVPYAVTLHTQIWTLGHAELTKHFGGVRSAQALAKSSVQALNVARLAFQMSGKDRWAAILTPEKLASLDPAVRDFLLTQSNKGAFNTSQTQWVYDGLHHHEGVQRALHDVSSAWTLYSEMIPRYATALAARELYLERAAQGKAPVSKGEFNDLHSFATHMVNQSQFSWLPDLNPRAFGKQGIAGTASPLVAQFQGFRTKLLEKMAREFADAFGKSGPEKATQARRFLLSHLAAQTALAGTMGLPFVGMFAGAYDRLADWVSGDHTHDIKASYRGWLSSVFGDQMGEALAHGAPRFTGVDLSGHLGEDRILPFTDLMANKRKLEDAYTDFLKGAAGSAAHLGYNIALGARDMVNGDYLEASSKMMPEVLRNFAEAGLMAKYGYTDKSGFQRPGITPSTKDVVAKGLGFEPADETNYQEKAHIAAGIRDRQEYDTTNIQQHLAKAYNRQDPANYAAWMAASNQFMLAHPGVMPPVGGFANFMTEHLRSAAIAGATGTPVGTSPRDFRMREAVSYGNGNK